MEGCEHNSVGVSSIWEKSAVWKGEFVGTCERYITKDGWKSDKGRGPLSLAAGVGPLSLGVADVAGDEGDGACELVELVSLGLSVDGLDLRFLDKDFVGSTRVCPPKIASAVWASSGILG